MVFLEIGLDRIDDEPSFHPREGGPGPGLLNETEQFSLGGPQFGPSAPDQAKAYQAHHQAHDDEYDQ